MVMSAAGLERIGLQSRINQYLGSKSECGVPIGVETEWVQPHQLRISAIVVSLDGSQSGDGDTLDARIETTNEADVLDQNLAA
ncbi:uncharacterized protein BP01DRAFT_390405 [Aspergillus saccharolyticus JOP 1030-1]|uniref:Pre-uroporphyrinogen synthase n=1 Tax=Aspergillus saccharolyticus JOP 1030-1 TaxID=1450539 RepID=A0A318ZIH0_9EURO|nr:hypothetical protein BP01DRAFT_390405 [Aspergillus saccharolyticus JOP 1030-1]PYH46725.1 hypothetical protein BP01DRAFT_390405 [Aspergillus saccharolyticus JOP 1030-1]